MKNITGIILLLFFGTLALKAQYTLSAFSGQAYTDITNPTYEIPDTSQYWGNVVTKPDMYFTAFGNAYNLYNNVFIPLKQGYAYFTNASRSTTVYAARGLFGARPGAGQTSVFSFKTDTTGNQKKLVLQWKNMGFENGNENDFINFQLWLYESGTIEVRFGPSSVKNGLWENGANGPTIGLLEMDETFSIIYNRLWLTGDAFIPTVSNNGTFLQMNSTPAEGMVYSFIPLSIGVDEIQQEAGYKIYPTWMHTTNTLTVEGSRSSNASQELKIFATDGRLLHQQPFSGNTTVNTSVLPAGIYVVSIQENGLPVSTTRIIKLD